MATQAELLAVGPLDGRYASKVSELAPVTSEFGLIRYRVAVEVGWLLTLHSGVLPDVPTLPDRTISRLERIPEEFTVRDAARVKRIEGKTNHDVKAVELWVKEKIADIPRVRQNPELVHFGLTSEDVNNLAYALMLSDARDKILGPSLDEIVIDLDEKAHEYADIPMKALTHGQPATPTTLGKEMRVFQDRLDRHVDRFGAIAIRGKLNSATGNYSAMSFAYPNVNWERVARRFISNELGFDFSAVTTQIEPHDWMVSYFNEVAHGNSIMLDLSKDMWQYISNGTFKLRKVKGETGSSIMPHKVNPIDFENAEANLGLANAILGWLSEKLPQSRLQRDLSDSSAQRAVGEALGHTLLSHKSLAKGMGKVNPDEVAIEEDLRGEWSLLMEPVQTVMRKHGIKGAYEAIKAVSRGQAITEADYVRLVASIKGLPEKEKAKLFELRPETYTGEAPRIARGQLSLVAV